MKPLFAELRVSKCSAEFLLNDIPFRRISAPAQPFFSRPALPFLRNGTNTLELIVEPGPTPATARIGRKPLTAGPAKAWTQIKAYSEGEWIGSEQGELVFRVNWPAPNPVELFAPLSLKQEFPFQHGLGSWAWERSDLLVLERDRETILQLVAVLHAAFAAGNPEPFLRMCEVHLFPELRRVFPQMTEAELKQNMISDIQGNRGRNNWVRPLELAKVELRLVAHGRAVQMYYPDWGPVLDTLPQPDGEAFPFHIVLGRLGKDWHILRWI